jgi:opacity protein-like surface antigen
MRLRPALVLFALLASAALAASDAPSPAKASGTFEDKKWKVKIGGAYAFWDKSAGMDDASVIQVAVSNSGFNADAFDGVFDRQHAINALFADDETKVVYFEFDEKGRYRGLSYYFESGDGCGYCFSTEVKSTVRAVDGRLKGDLSYSGDDRTFQIQLDVPIPPKKWGEPLPPDGGEPGKVFLAYHAALDKRDAKALSALVDADYRERIQKYRGDGKLDAYLDYRWKDEHTELKTIRITGGFVRGDRAVVLFDGSNAYIDHLYGEAQLLREGGKWLVDRDMVEVGTRP